MSRVLQTFMVRIMCSSLINTPSTTCTNFPLFTFCSTLNKGISFFNSTTSKMKKQHHLTIYTIFSLIYNTSNQTLPKI